MSNSLPNGWTEGWEEQSSVEQSDYNSLPDGWSDGWNIREEEPEEKDLKIIDPLQEGVKDIAKSGLGFAQMVGDVAQGSNADKFRNIIRNASESKILQPDPDYEKSEGWRGYVEDVIRMSPQVATQFGVALTPAGAVGSAAFMGSQISGGKYADLRKDDVPVIRAIQASLSDAAMQAPIEALSLGRAMKLWKPGRKAMEVARDVGGAMGTEFITEWVQKYPDLATEIWAKSKDVPVEEQVNKFIEGFGDATKEGVYEGLVAAPFGGLIRGGSAVLNKNVDTTLDASDNKDLDPTKPITAKTEIEKELADQQNDEFLDSVINDADNQFKGMSNDLKSKLSNIEQGFMADTEKKPPDPFRNIAQATRGLPAIDEQEVQDIPFAEVPNEIQTQPIGNLEKIISPEERNRIENQGIIDQQTELEKINDFISQDDEFLNPTEGVNQANTEPILHTPETQNIHKKYSENIQAQSPVVSKIMDRKNAFIDLLSEVKNPKNRARLEKRLVDPLLGEYGVTTTADFEETISELEDNGIDYVLEAVDGGNLGGANAHHGEVHAKADADVKKIWGDVLTKNVQKFGGAIFRTGGDEFRIVWPGYTKDEVQEIRDDIEAQIRNQIAAIGLDKVAHPKHGNLPTGALYTSYGFASSVDHRNPKTGRINKGDMDSMAEDDQGKMSRLYIDSIAAQEGKWYNTETQTWEDTNEPRKLEQEKGSTERGEFSGSDKIPGQSGASRGSAVNVGTKEIHKHDTRDGEGTNRPGIRTESMSDDSQTKEITTEQPTEDQKEISLTEVENLEEPYKMGKEKSEDQKEISFYPTQPVTWKTKSDKPQSGTIIGKKGKYWSVKKENGKTAIIPEKDVIEIRDNRITEKQSDETKPDKPIFIRKLTAKEKLNKKTKFENLANLPEKEGYEKVYKPYGTDGEKSGSGFYYSPIEDDQQLNKDTDNKKDTQSTTDEGEKKSSNNNQYLNIVKLAADTPSALRVVDVDRVMDAAIDANIFDEFKSWLLKQDLRGHTYDKVLSIHANTKKTSNIKKEYIIDKGSPRSTIKGQKQKLLDSIDEAINNAPAKSNTDSDIITFKDDGRFKKLVITDGSFATKRISKNVVLKYVIAKDRNQNLWQFIEERGGIQPRVIKSFTKLQDTKKYVEAYFNGGLNQDGEISFKGEGYETTIPNSRYHLTNYRDSVLKSQGAKFSASSDFTQGQPLVSVHNLTGENILHADKMGGLAVPSIAITSPDTGGFEGFGDISLISDPSLIDPRISSNNKVFNADAYSPRYPNVVFKINESKLRKAWDRLNDSSVDLGHRLSSELDESEIERKGIKAFYDSTTVKYEYLKSLNKKPMLKYEKKPNLPKYFKIFKGSWLDLVRNKSFIAAANKYYQSKTKEIVGYDKTDLFFDGDGGKLNRRLLDDLARQVQSMNEPRKVDFYAMRQVIDGRIKTSKAKENFKLWVNDKFNDVIIYEQIPNGHTYSGDRKFLPHDLDTVVKLMKKGLKDGENFNYGVGSIRAVASKQFKSLAGIKTDRDKIVSKDVIEELKKEVDDEFMNLAEDLKFYYKYDTKSFGYLDEVSNAFKDFARKGHRGFDEYYENVPDDTIVDVRAFLQKLREMPTEYFEAKIQRAVNLNEFVYAVVPKGTDKAVKNVLKKNGVQIRLYDTKQDGDRARVISSLKKGVLFQTDQTPGQGVSLKDIQKRFKDQNIFISPDGSISIRFKNGKGTRIKSVKQIGGGDVLYAIETGRMGKNGIILGKTVGTEITLNENLADKFTLAHELKHVLDNLGMITPKENMLLQVEFDKAKKQNKLRFEPSKAKDKKLASDENRANMFAQLLANRENFRGTVIGKMIQKVMDFLDGIVHIGRQSATKFAKEVESGKVFERQSENGFDGIEASKETSESEPKFQTSDDLKKVEKRTNTTNQTAEQGGSKYKGSAEKGQQSIEKIMSDLRKTATTKSEKVRASIEKEQKIIDGYRQLELLAKNPQASIASKQKMLASFLKVLPPNVRAKVITPLSSISRFKQIKTHKKRIEESLSRAENELVSYLRRNLTAEILTNTAPRKLAKNRIKKGTLGHEADRDLQFIRETLKEKDPNFRISQIENQIKNKEEELEEAEENKAKILEEEIADLESNRNIIDTFGAIKSQNLEDLLFAKEALNSIILNGRALWRSQQDAFKEALEPITDNVQQDISGQADPELETAAEATKRSAAIETAWGKAKGTWDAVENSILSWEFLMNKLSKLSGDKVLQSFTTTEMGSIVQSATQQENILNIGTDEEIHSNAKDIFNAKSDTALNKKFLKQEIKQTGKVFSYDINGNKVDDFVMSQMQAAYMYAIRKNEDSLPTFDKMGMTDKTFDEIETFIGPELKAWVDFNVDEYLQDFHFSVNDVYRQVYGTNLTKTPGYISWYRDVPGKVQEKGIAASPHETGAKGLSKGAFKERVNNTNPYKFMSFNDVLTRHVAEMNNFKAWAMPSKVINGVFNNRKTQRLITQHHSDNMRIAIRSFQTDFTKSPLEMRGEMPWLDKMRGNITTAMTALNPTIFLKQLTSIPAMAESIPTKDWIKHSAGFWSNPLKAWNLLKDSKHWEARRTKGMERDIRTAQAVSGSQAVANVKNIKNRAMFLVKWGDGAAILAGGYPVYKYHFDKNVGSMGRDKAHKFALSKFETAMDRTQQASGIKDQGKFQRSGSYAKLFSMFMTAPKQYTSQITAAIRQIHSNPKDGDAYKRLFIFGVMMPSLFQATASGLVGLVGGDEEDKEKFVSSQIKAILQSPLNGIPIIRDLQKGVWESAMGEWYGTDVEYSPVTEAGQSLLDAVFNGAKLFAEDQTTEKRNKHLEKTVNNLLETIGYGSGLPVESVRKMFMENWADIITGKTDYPFRRGIGFSRFATNEKDSRFVKEKRRLERIGKEFEKSKDKSKFKSENKRELIRLKRIRKLQGKLNGYQRRINKLKTLKKSARIESQISKLEEKRESFIKRFLEKK